MTGLKPKQSIEIILTTLGRPPTLNRVVRMNSIGKRSKITREWREAATQLWSYHDAEIIPPVKVIATPLHNNMCSPQDAGACLPAVKATIDGAVDTGLLADDDYRYVRSVILEAPEFSTVDGLRVRLES